MENFKNWQEYHHWLPFCPILLKLFCNLTFSGIVKNFKKANNQLDFASMNTLLKQ
jgi:hypothetical protein